MHFDVRLKMILAFGDLIFSLGLFALLCLSAVVFLFVATDSIRRRRFSKSRVTVAILALMPLIVFTSSFIRRGQFDYNPSSPSIEKISGLYSNQEQEILLKADGTYTSSSIDGLAESGTWTNFDWNLTFENSELTQPRWVLRNGEPGIFPFYSGVDGPDGVFLQKQR